ncbi:hypothetical protein M0802_013767 [Mischocyttarus mexicanus]|nr:hypothetical protein M0802_013767 [Mischocyttarus mexicanus]
MRFYCGRRLQTGRSHRAKRKNRDAKTPSPPPRRCLLCQRRGHELYQCSRFLDLSKSARWDTVNKYGLCTNCLGKHNDRCRAKRCQMCYKFHHIALHQNTNKLDPSVPETMKEAREEATT